MHAKALITERRTICTCGWYKLTKGKERGVAAMARHIAKPTESPHTPTVSDHQEPGCKIEPINHQWAACTVHNQYLIPDTEPVREPATGQTEMSFT